MDAQTAKLIEDVESAAKAQTTAVDSIVAAHNRYAEELDVMGNDQHETVDVLKTKLRDMAQGMRDNTSRIVDAIKHGTELDQTPEGPKAEEHGDDPVSTTAEPGEPAQPAALAEDDPGKTDGFNGGDPAEPKRD